MSESSRLGRARGRMLPVAIVATALVAMLALAPLANAAPSKIASGTTTLTINKGFNKQAKKAGIKVIAQKPTTVKGTKATFTVSGGEVEPATGVGTITHSGGLKLKWGKKSVALRGVEVNTSTKSLSASVGGSKVKLATLAGVSTARLGFGTSVTAKKVKLTAAGAKALNGMLTPKPTKTKVKKNGKTIVKTVKVKPPFKANMVLGSTTTQVEPETVNVLATGTMTYNGDGGLFGKLHDVGVNVETISPTGASGNTFTSAISGGTLSPLGTSGQINSAGGIKLVQKLEGTPYATTITLGSIGVDLAAKTATVEVNGESNVEVEGKKPLNVGNLGRSSIADLTITSTPSPATRTVSVSATAAIQPVAAEVLEGFVKVYEGAYALKYGEELAKKAEEEFIKSEGKILPPSKTQIEEAAKKAAAERVANDHIKAGESLGSFSFTATGE
jgi:hypothetical protein